MYIDTNYVSLAFFKMSHIKFKQKNKILSYISTLYESSAD